MKNFHALFPWVAGGAFPGLRERHTPPTAADMQADLIQLLNKGYRHIIDLTNEPDIPELPANPFVIHRIPVKDGTPPSIDQMWHVCSIVDATRGNGMKTLIHCWNGDGRTGTCLAGYCMKLMHMNLEEVIEFLQRTHPKAAHHMEQKAMLTQWESELAKLGF